MDYKGNKKEWISKQRMAEVTKEGASNIDKVALMVDENYSDFVKGCSQKVARAIKR